MSILGKFIVVSSPINANKLKTLEKTNIWKLNSYHVVYLMNHTVAWIINKTIV